MLRALAFVVMAVSGVLLAATLLHEQVANARSLAQLVLVTNTRAQAVPVREQGTPHVGVTGTVATKQALPARAFSVMRRFGGGPGTGVAPVLPPDLPDTTYVVVSVTATNRTDSPQFGEKNAQYGLTPDCRIYGGIPEFRFGPSFAVPARDTVHLAFPQPFVIPVHPEGTSCLIMSASGRVDVAVVGYRK